MKRILFASTLGILLAATAAFAQDVRYNFDKNTDFSKFRTYRSVSYTHLTLPTIYSV